MMQQKNYSATISLNKSLHEIMEGISNVSGWWATHVEGSTKKINDVFTVRFGKTFSIMEVTELVPDKKMVWLVKDSYLPLFADAHQWNDTSIAWEISSDGYSPQLTMTHIGLTPGKECYNDCNKGWDFYVKESLRRLITDGKGFPGTGIFAHIFNEDRKYEGLLYSKNDPLPNVTGDYNLIDVKGTKGEQVVAIYSAEKLNRESFTAEQLKGEYYLLVENTPSYNDLEPLADLKKLVTT
jgi:hypothetical protein